MDVFALLADGFATSLSPLNLMIVILGVTAGLFIGAMPGLGSVNGVAIVLPMTFIVPPESAIILLAAIYYGAMYGGAVSSVLLGIPGASTAVATTFDGRPMAQQGKAGPDRRRGGVFRRGYDFRHPVHAFRGATGRRRAGLWPCRGIRACASRLHHIRGTGRR